MRYKLPNTPPIIFKPDNTRFLVLLFYGFIGILYWILAWYLEQIHLDPAIQSEITVYIDKYALLEPLAPTIVFIRSMLTWHVLRHFIPVILGVVFGKAIVTKFTREFYNLTSDAMANKFLMRIQNGIAKALPINRRNFSRERQDNPILSIGGPGKIAVGKSDVVLTEINARYNRILPPGTHRLARFEYIHSVLSLQDQERAEGKVRLMTREGIEITTTVHIKFRLGRGGRPATPRAPHPFDPDDIYAAVYSVLIDQENKVGDWHQKPLPVAIAHLRRYIATLQLDQVLDLKKQHITPHAAVVNEITQKIKNDLQKIGVDLIRLDIGSLQIPEKLRAVVIDYWKMFHDKQKATTELTEQEQKNKKLVAEGGAREKMIQALSTSYAQLLSASSQSGADMPRDHIMAYRMMDVIDNFLGESKNYVAVPKELVTKLYSLRERLTVVEEAGAPRPAQGNDRSTSNP